MFFFNYCQIAKILSALKISEISKISKMTFYRKYHPISKFIRGYQKNFIRVILH